MARLEGVATAASRFTITPFVGFLDRPPEPRRQPGRGGAGAPGARLGADGSSLYREERWDGFRRDMSVFFFELADETVWGATARILTDLLTRLVTPSP